MTEQKPQLYGYRAIVRGMYDGDTVRVDIDLGCKVWLNDEPIRLYGINAPEIRGEERPEGLKSLAFLETLIQPGDEILLKTYRDKKGKYGRWLGEIWVDGKNVNQLLVENGYAKPADY